MHEGMPWEGLDCRYQDNLKDDVPRVITNIHLPKRGLDGPPPTAISLFRNLTEIDMVRSILGLLVHAFSNGFGYV